VETNNDNHNGLSNANSMSNLSIANIYSIEPLKIKSQQNEEARAPNIDECESIIKNLYEIYKQQKQQVSQIYSLFYFIHEE
jgi:hypothetical protein